MLRGALLSGASLRRPTGLQPAPAPARVLITTDAVGGVWRYALDLAAVLGGRGTECLLAGFGPPPGAARLAAARAVPGVSVAWTGGTLDWLVRDEAALDGADAALATLARDWGADLLHLNMASQAARLPAGAPVVVASHSCVPSWWAAVRGGDLPADWRWHERRNRHGFDRARVVLAPSAAHAAALQRAYGPIAGLRVVHNATGAFPADEAPLTDKGAASSGPGGDEPFVFAAGRWWDEAKGADTLDAAAAAAAWPVVMAGPLDGPSGQRAAITGAEALGELPARDVWSLMRRAAVFAAPSRFEPFGLAVLEAAAGGSALVLSDIPTFRELWEGAALFAPANDPAAWTRAINRLAGDPALRSRLSTAARRRAETFTPARQLAGILDGYAAAAGVAAPAAGQGH